MRALVDALLDHLLEGAFSLRFLILAHLMEGVGQSETVGAGQAADLYGLIGCQLQTTRADCLQQVEAHVLPCLLPLRR